MEDVILVVLIIMGMTFALAIKTHIRNAAEDKKDTHYIFYPQKEGSFCKECGVRLSDVWNGEYSPHTGTQKLIKACLSISCCTGCVNTGGHRWPLFQKYCRKCNAELDTSYE